jgi:circadian clock protein KaiB
LRLYVAGTTPKSLRAVQNVKRICDAELAGQYDLEIVDVYKEPGRLAKDHVVAIPTLVKLAPGIIKRLIGDLSQEAQVRKGLGLLAA